LNYLLTSHVWRQDHNGFSHQDPGFIDLVVNKKADIVRVYFPPDANCLLSVADHCLRSRDYVNVIVAGKNAQPNWLNMDAAVKHCTSGIGIWEWASNDKGSEPDVVMACCGDVPTIETLAAVDMLRDFCPDLKVRVINVVDLMTLQPREEHPHGLSNYEFDTLFTADKPERPGPVPPGAGRGGPGAETGVPGGVRAAGGPRQADRPLALHLPLRRGHAGDPGLDMETLRDAGAGTDSMMQEPSRRRLAARRQARSAVGATHASPFAYARHRTHG
jgi:hypothetical protein